MLRDEYERVIKDVASEVTSSENEEGWIDAGEVTDFTVWQKGKRRTIYLLDTDWKNPSRPAECNLIFGNYRYPVPVPCGMLSTIHCEDGIAIYPASNTTDVLDIRKKDEGWAVTIQTTGADSFRYFEKEDNRSGSMSVPEAGIHTIIIPIFAPCSAK